MDSLSAGPLKVSLRARIKRYPAKMVTNLADKLLKRYAIQSDTMLDPFCGSGELLVHAANRGLTVAGFDINPYATLLTKVRLEGFNVGTSVELLEDALKRSLLQRTRFPIDWLNKDYWFTASTLEKYERLRAVARSLDLQSTREGRSVLLSIGLSVRMCSRADERSPKPFISKSAIKRKKGRHIDPFKIIRLLHTELSTLYGGRRFVDHRVRTVDVVSSPQLGEDVRRYSLVMTSPPYLNAQDYFRNFKLELYVLEGVVPFRVHSLWSHFIGTERGDLLERLSLEDLELNRDFLPNIIKIEEKNPDHAVILHRYLVDMRIAFTRIRGLMRKGGTLVIVCGDNLIAGVRVKTWRAVNRLLSSLELKPFDSFCDQIRARSLPPKRSGHKGLIKEEHVTAFRAV